MPLTPYSVSNGSLSRKSNSFVRAPQVRKSATAAATSTSIAHSPRPAAAFSVMPKRADWLISLKDSNGTGESTLRNVASAIRGAA